MKPWHPYYNIAEIFLLIQESSDYDFLYDLLDVLSRNKYSEVEYKLITDEVNERLDDILKVEARKFRMLRDTKCRNCGVANMPFNDKCYLCNCQI